MIQNIYRITNIKKLNSVIAQIRFKAPEIAKLVQQGQFVNIRIDETTVPLLRRPFSVYNIIDDEIEIVFGIFGMGTKKLNEKKIGDSIDVIGPLGKPFNIDEEEEISILLAGGLGAASLPILYKNLEKRNRKTLIFLGAKTKEYLLKDYLPNPFVSTDDGSEGFKGNVVSLLDHYLSNSTSKSYKIYACGPTAMLIELNKIVEKYNVACEVSLETMMACGVGICQGCAVKLKNDPRNFALSCVDGPVFNIKNIVI